MKKLYIVTAIVALFAIYLIVGAMRYHSMDKPSVVAWEQCKYAITLVPSNWDEDIARRHMIKNVCPSAYFKS